MRVEEIADLYDRIAFGYHHWWVPVIEPAGLHLLDLVAPLVAERPDARIVDLGAGTGTLARAAVARWPLVEVVAVDPSAGMLELGRAEAARTLDPSARERLQWTRGRAEELPLQAGAADIVISAFVLQYLPPRVVALREAWRVLRPGGEIALVTWLRDDITFEPWRLLDQLLNELGIARPPSGEAAGIFRSLPSAAVLLRRAGFRQVHASRAELEYQWTVDALFHCAVESEEQELFDSLDPPIRDRLMGLWRERLNHLTPSELLYRDCVAYAAGHVVNC